MIDLNLSFHYQYSVAYIVRYTIRYIIIYTVRYATRTLWTLDFGPLSVESLSHSTSTDASS